MKTQTGLQNKLLEKPGFQDNKDAFSRLLFVVTLLLVFLMASRTPLDSDLWWHLRSGQVMVETGRPLLVDTFSFTRDGMPWTNHSWLGELVLIGIYNIAGFYGLSAMVGLCAVAIVGLIWSQVPGKPFTKSVFTLFSAIISAPIWTPRPQLFSLVLLALLAWLISRKSTLSRNNYFWIVVLFIFWSNMHGGFVLGVILLVATAAGLIIDGFLDETGMTLSKTRQAAGLVIVSLAGYVVSAINPNGIKMWLIPFETIGVNVLRQLIQEWASPDFHQKEVWPFLFLVLFSFLTLAIREKRIQWRFVVPAFIFISMSFFAQRNIGPAAIISIPWLARIWSNIQIPANLINNLPGFIRSFIDRLRVKNNPKQSSLLTRIVNLSIVGLLGFVCFFKLASAAHPVIFSAYEEKMFPTGAVDYIKSHPNPREGRLFNSYSWGGYLIWFLPEEKVYIDGRTDLYGDEILNEWITNIQADEGWKDLLESRGITRVLIEPDRPLAKLLPLDGGIIVYRDKNSVIIDLPR